MRTLFKQHFSQTKKLFILLEIQLNVLLLTVYKHILQFQLFLCGAVNGTIFFIEGIRPFINNRGSEALLVLCILIFVILPCTIDSLYKLAKAQSKLEIIFFRTENKSLIVLLNSVILILTIHFLDNECIIWIINILSIFIITGVYLVVHIFNIIVILGSFNCRREFISLFIGLVTLSIVCFISLMFILLIQQNTLDVDDALKLLHANHVVGGTLLRVLLSLLLQEFCLSLKKIITSIKNFNLLKNLLEGRVAKLPLLLYNLILFFFNFIKYLMWGIILVLYSYLCLHSALCQPGLTEDIWFSIHSLGNMTMAEITRQHHCEGQEVNNVVSVTFIAFLFALQAFVAPKIPPVIPISKEQITNLSQITIQHATIALPAKYIKYKTDITSLSNKAFEKAESVGPLDSIIEEIVEKTPDINFSLENTKIKPFTNAAEQEQFRQFKIAGEKLEQSVITKTHAQLIASSTGGDSLSSGVNNVVSDAVAKVNTRLAGEVENAVVKANPLNNESNPIAISTSNILPSNNSIATSISNNKVSIEVNPKGGAISDAISLDSGLIKEKIVESVSTEAASIIVDTTSLLAASAALILNPIFFIGTVTVYAGGLAVTAIISYYMQ